MVGVLIVDRPGRVQCSKSHESSLATSRQCWWKFWKSRRDLPIPEGGLLVPGGRERTGGEEQLQPQIEGDGAQGLFVKVKKAPSASSLGEWNGDLAAGHAEYRGWCPLCKSVPKHSDRMSP